MKKNLRGIFVAVIAVALIAGYYYYLSSRETTPAEGDTQLTEVQKVNTLNLEDNYPVTPREVVKLYNRIMCCYYNEEFTDEELMSLASQARMLMDDELLLNNPENVYLIQLQTEIDSYRENGKTIFDTTVSSSSDVVYETIDEHECAYVDASYFIKEASSFTKSYETYLLRKDSDGNWKILAFYLKDDATEASES